MGKKRGNLSRCSHRLRVFRLISFLCFVVALLLFPLSSKIRLFILWLFRSHQTSQNETCGYQGSREASLQTQRCHQGSVSCIKVLQCFGWSERQAKLRDLLCCLSCLHECALFAKPAKHAVCYGYATNFPGFSERKVQSIVDIRLKSALWCILCRTHALNLISWVVAVVDRCFSRALCSWRRSVWLRVTKEVEARVL